MMADSRQISYSFLTVRPTGDFFWSLPFCSINGADAVFTWPVGENLLRGKLFYGLSDGSFPLADKQWSLDGSSMASGYLGYQSRAWLFRLGYANFRFKHDLPIDDVLQAHLPQPTASEAAPQLIVAGARSDCYSLGAIYDSGSWQLQVMLNYGDQGSQAFESSSGGYALAGYRIASIMLYPGYSRVRSESRQGALNPVVAAIMADRHADKKTTIVGARWGWAGNLALKAQWDGIRGEPTSILPYRRERAGWSGKMDVFP